MTAAAFDLDEIEPWTDPDHPDAVLDAAYRAGIVPPDQRWVSDFTYRPTRGDDRS
jgi:hypothetical protein